jgi:hypothetical protein
LGIRATLAAKGNSGLSRQSLARLKPSWDTPPMKSVLIMVLTSLASNAWAANQYNACEIAAFTDYNRANLTLLTKHELIMTVETTISQRRLQEQYCLRVAHCQIADLPLQKTTMALDTAFSVCLRDEVMEKFELVPANGN